MKRAEASRKQVVYSPGANITRISSLSLLEESQLCRNLVGYTKSVKAKLIIKVSCHLSKKLGLNSIRNLYSILSLQES